MAQTLPSTRYLDPAAIARIKHLGLAARLVVEGLYAGQHRSPHRGFSVEFAEHREYTPGVDPRHLDWKILAKRDKLYIKQYEEQTNLRCFLLVDASASMGYQHTGELTKLQYACYCAASLAYLMQSQHDAFGLITFDRAIEQFVPARQGKAHLSVILDHLDKLEPRGETDLAAALDQLAERIKRRALIVVISDFFGASDQNASDIIRALGRLRHKKNEVIALHTLDRAELEFPFRDASQIEDIETGVKIDADAEAIRSHYLEQLQKYLDAMRTGCVSNGIEYALGDTTEPFDAFLSRYLSRRQGLRAGRGG